MGHTFSREAMDVGSLALEVERLEKKLEAQHRSDAHATRCVKGVEMRRKKPASIGMEASKACKDPSKKNTDGEHQAASYPMRRQKRRCNYERCLQASTSRNDRTCRTVHSWFSGKRPETNETVAQWDGEGSKMPRNWHRQRANLPVIVSYVCMDCSAG